MLQVGQSFSDKASVVEAVTKYCLTKNQSFDVYESKPHTITLTCGRTPPCTWKFRVSKKESYIDDFTIVSYGGPHERSCVSDTVPHDHKNLKGTFLTNAIKNLVNEDWSIKICLLIEFIRDKFNYTISYWKAWNAKQRAIAELFGDWEKSYEILPHFMQSLQESNHGTIVKWVTTPTSDVNVHAFKRVFWAFRPSIEGFEYCRPVITVDGTHLYGKYKGTLLIAIGTDANNQIFPLAFALVESENTNSWPWFMACIRAFVTKRNGVCVISYRHAGLIKAMNEQYSEWEEPFAYHRFCFRHLTSNVATRFKSDKIKKLFGYTAMQNQKKKFESGWKQLGQLDKEAQTYVSNIGLDKWSLHHDGGFRYGCSTTNMAEVFNNVLKGARFLPVTALVTCIFYRVNAYFYKRREWARNRMLDGFLYSEKITKRMKANLEKSAHHQVVKLDRENGRYQVNSGQGNRGPRKGNHIYTVDLPAKSCMCYKFQIFKYPCAHVHAVCREMSLSTTQYVDTFYSTEKHLASYMPTFRSLQDKDYWSPYTGVKIVCDESRKRGKGRLKGKLSQ